MQLPPQAHPPPAGAAARREPPPDVAAAKSEMRRMTRAESHLGHAGSSSLMPRSRSKSDPHAEHSYSYSGMQEVYAERETSRDGLSLRPEGADALTMKVLATDETRSHIRERGGLLFVWVTRPRGTIRSAVRFLKTSTEPPENALEWERVEAKGFLVFLPPGLRRPRELHLEVRGRLKRRRVDAFWDGCVFVM
jgi:hypothetical protein